MLSQAQTSAPETMGSVRLSSSRVPTSVEEGTSASNTRWSEWVRKGKEGLT